MIKTVVIAGPTCSGKSGIATALAERLNGVVINADSLQVYRELRVLSARPSEADEARAPHALYGYLRGDEPCTAARWAQDAAQAVRQCAAEGRLPILTGGTGLYLEALMQGLSPMPEVPAASTAAAQALLDAHGLPGLYDTLAAAAPEHAHRLEPANRQRMLRAYAVWHSTGKPIHWWQDQGAQPLLPEADFRSICLFPERQALYAACDTRFRTMLKDGAVEEVKALLALDYPDHLTVMKAVGVAELRDYLHGTLSLEAAEALATQRTRNYAKRQMTWFRNRMHGSHAFSFGQFHDPATLHEIMSCVNAFLF